MLPNERGQKQPVRGYKRSIG